MNKNAIYFLDIIIDRIDRMIIIMTQNGYNYTDIAQSLRLSVTAVRQRVKSLNRLIAKYERIRLNKE